MFEKDRSASVLCMFIEEIMVSLMGLMEYIR